ncbi:MAG: endonuclease domain-containing protein [Planctomycetota bacterium]|nr:endonuclease domain-containing protein [Planctomycetota bacterium]
MTIPERRLWNLLRNRQLAELKFRRQVPVGPFVVDFYCEAAQLAVELDGLSHDNRGEYDKRRQKYLEEQGIRVLRMQNDELLENAEAVLLGIAKAAGVDLRTHYGNLFGAAQAANAAAGRPLTPDPSPEGEGGWIRRERKTSEPTTKREQRHRPPNAP